MSHRKFTLRPGYSGASLQLLKCGCDVIKYVFLCFRKITLATVWDVTRKKNSFLSSLPPSFSRQISVECCVVRCARCCEPSTEGDRQRPEPARHWERQEGKAGSWFKGCSRAGVQGGGWEKGAGLRHNWREEGGEEESPQLEGERVQSGDGGIALARERSHTSWRQARGLAVGKGEMGSADGALF